MQHWLKATEAWLKLFIYEIMFIYMYKFLNLNCFFNKVNLDEI